MYRRHRMTDICRFECDGQELWLAERLPGLAENRLDYWILLRLLENCIELIHAETLVNAAMSTHKLSRPHGQGS